MSNDPLVSILFLSYQQENFIIEAIDSVLHQNYKNVELLISDDGSTDRTRELLDKVTVNCIQDINIKVVHSNKNLGLVGNFNKLCSIAKGDYFCPAAGDDIFLADRITKAVNVFRENQDVAIVGFFDDVCDKNGNIFRNRKSRSPLSYSLKEYLKNKTKHPSGASRLFKRELYDRFGPIVVDCKTEDTPYLMRGLYLGRVYILNSPGLIHRSHNDALSHQKNINKMPLLSILAQYLLDLESAKKDNLIDEEHFKLAFLGVVSKIQKRVNLRFESNILDKIKRIVLSN